MNYINNWHNTAAIADCYYVLLHHLLVTLSSQSTFGLLLRWEWRPLPYCVTDGSQEGEARLQREHMIAVLYNGHDICKTTIQYCNTDAVLSSWCPWDQVLCLSSETHWLWHRGQNALALNVVASMSTMGNCDTVWHSLLLFSLKYIWVCYYCIGLGLALASKWHGLGLDFTVVHTWHTILKYMLRNSHKEVDSEWILQWTNEASYNHTAK